jgi:hypothetical protein
MERVDRTLAVRGCGKAGCRLGTCGSPLGSSVLAMRIETSARSASRIVPSLVERCPVRHASRRVLLEHAIPEELAGRFATRLGDPGCRADRESIAARTVRMSEGSGGLARAPECGAGTPQRALGQRDLGRGDPRRNAAERSGELVSVQVAKRRVLRDMVVARTGIEELPCRGGISPRPARLPGAASTRGGN